MAKSDGFSEPQFWPDSAIGEFASSNALSCRQAMGDLLGRNIWPERFRRNYGLLTAESQIKLLNLPIFIAGCGGLGGEMASMLCRLGAGRIRLCDYDSFEESNLNRQLFCTEKTLGKSKALVTAEGLSAIASWGEYQPLATRIDENNGVRLIRDSAIVVDCLDSVSGKKMLENIARVAAKTFLHGSVLHLEGFSFLADPAGDTLARMYGEETAASGAGAVLSPVVTGLASIMCSLFIRWINGAQEIDRIIHIDFSLPELEKFQLP